MQVDVTVAEPAEWKVVPPSWRFDLAIEEDLVEEVARVYGYDRIPALQETAAQALRGFSETRIPAERGALLLVDRGYQEAITYSFTDPALQETLLPGSTSLALANPISAEMAVMRLSLWPGLLQSLQQNQKRQQPRVRLFETGRQFSADGKQEIPVIAGLAGGLLVPKQWASSNSAIDFYDVKADVESLLALTGRPEEFSFVPATHPALHPGQCARIERLGQPVGWLGSLSPVLVKSLDLVYPAVLFELEIIPTFASHVPEYQEISKFPMVRRDLALLVADNLKFTDLAQAARESAGPLLRELNIFDVYQGAGLEKGKKSIALGINLQDTSRTLTDVEVDTVVTAIVLHLSQRFDARLRDK